MILQTKVQRDFSQSTYVLPPLYHLSPKWDSLWQADDSRGQLYAVLVPASDLFESSRITLMEIALHITFCLHNLRLHMLTSIVSLLPCTT